MAKEKIRLLIPLLILTGIIGYCWSIFFFTEIGATWKHRVGLLFFIIIMVCFFKNSIVATVGTGIYLVLATFKLLAITPAILIVGLRVGPVSMPGIKPLSLGLFILYFVLNLDPLINIHLDYNEAKQKKREQNKLS